MKVSALTAIFIATALALAAADNEIGYCENLGSGSTTTTVDWSGIFQGILTAIPGIGGIIGAIFDFIPSISQGPYFKRIFFCSETA